MRTYVAQVSSLYPIDLAAALYAGVSETNASIRIFLSDAAELPNNLQVREFVSRSALPTCAWSFDHAKVWRQRHIPLEDLETSDLMESLLLVGDSLRTDYDDEGVVRRCIDLAQLSRARAASSSLAWRSLWAPFVSGIIEEIFQQVLQIPAHVEPYWPFRLGMQHVESNSWSASRETLRRLLDEAFRSSPQTLAFLRGGYIEIENPSTSGEWLRFSKIAFDGSIVDFRGENETLRLTGTEAEDMHFRLGGPLEMIQLKEFGFLVDLPWYSDATLSRDESETHSGIEFISPITVNTNKRVSRMTGGEDFRLTPSGYSLVEFDSPVIRQFISRKLKTHVCSDEDLADWRRLSREFPSTAQRLSKDQHAVRSYRNLRETQSRQRIMNGDLSTLAILSARFDDIHPLSYGSYLTELLGAITLLKEWVSPACPNAAKPNVLEFLHHLNWIDPSGLVAPVMLVREIEVACGITRRWLETVGGSFNAMDSRRTEEACEALLRLGSRSILQSAIRDSSPAGFGLAAKTLRDVLDAYYAFAGFCVGALFKAHILFPYLLLGPDEYRSQIEKHLLLRGDRKCLAFDPILWTTEENKVGME